MPAHYSNSKPAGNGNGHGNNYPKYPHRENPKLLAWARQITKQRTAGIEEGVSGVRDPNAYRAISERNFFIEIEKEVDDFLSIVIEKSIRRKFNADSLAIIYESEVRALVKQATDLFALPVNEETYRRAVEGASVTITPLREETRSN